MGSFTTGWDMASNPAPSPAKILPALPFKAGSAELGPHMFASLDSATPPTSAQVAAAKAAGIGMWCVYIATKANVGF